MPPVSIQFMKMDSNKLPESTSKFNMEDEEGVEDSDVPFIVHGLTDEPIDLN